MILPLSLIDFSVPELNYVKNMTIVPSRVKQGL